METERPQHRHAAFLRYEPLLAKAVSAYPSTTYCTPKNLALETVVARFRDATNAFIRNKHWQSETVDREKLEENWEAMEVAIDGDKVRIGPRRKRTKGAVASLTADVEAGTSAPRKLLVHKPSVEALNALLLLHSEGVLVDPTHVQGYPYAIQEHKLPPNVEIIPEGDDFIIL